MTHLPIAQETTIENRDDGFEEVAPVSSQQLIVEEEQVPVTVTEAEAPLLEPVPKVDLSKYMMLIPADQFRNFVTVPVPLPTIPIPVPSIGSSYGSSGSVSSSVSDSVSVSTSVSSSSGSYGQTLRSISGVKGGPTVVRSEMIKGLPPPPAARKTSSSTIILP